MDLSDFPTDAPGLNFVIGGADFDARIQEAHAMVEDGPREALEWSTSRGGAPSRALAEVLDWMTSV